MRTNTAARPWRTSLAWSAVFRAAGLSIFGLIAWLWLFSADGPAWRAVSLVAAQALAALAGVAWYLPRARAERRWRAALDHYGEQEQALHDHRLQGRTGGTLASTGAGRDRCPRPTLSVVDEQHRPIGTVFCLDVLAALARRRTDGAGS
jgi:4-amino-4-deoxy-L-arabinose transferase-like glycosyltransferase